MIVESWAIIPVVAIVMWGLVQIFRVRSRALGHGRPGALPPDDASLRPEVEDLRRRVMELEERQDFTERMLTRGGPGGRADG